MTSLYHHILDIVFPRKCLGCAVLMPTQTGDSVVCRDCLANIDVPYGFACAFCASPVIKGATCHFCKRDGRFLDRLWVSAPYSDKLIESIIKNMKYKYVYSLAKITAELMINFADKKVGDLVKNANPLVVPVPLSRRRLNMRGFNQSEIIAADIAAYFGMDFAPQALKRLRDTPPQASLGDRRSRVINMKGVFGCANTATITGRRILLIDDVSTTGSTLDDCARALKAGGAEEVTGFVFARNKI